MSRILILLTALMFSVAPLAAATETPAMPEAWVAQMLDGKRNGMAIKDPTAFAEWLDAVTEPRFMTALAAVAAEPGTYPKIMADAVDPASARNWSEFTDPQLYLRWMLASTAPSFQQAIVRKMSDPAKLKRWIEMASRPDTYTPMLANITQAPAAWIQAPLQPANQSAMTKPMNPGLLAAWLSTMANGVGRQVQQGQDWLQLPTTATAPGAPRHRY